jgi:predicted CXXCH cytochrome family protein
MKKLLLAAAVALYASTAMAQISGSRHDLTTGFTGNAWPGTAGACTYCHAPHNSNTGVTGAPLWNRATVTGGAAWTMYSSTTIKLPVGAAPGTNSLLCLACHDGTQAIAVVYNGGTGQNLSGNGNTATIGGIYNVGRDLSNDHPVAIRYDATVDTGLTPATINAGTATVGVFRLYADGAGNYTVECGSCHDPHGVTGTTFFLRAQNNTALCTACHATK